MHDQRSEEFERGEAEAHDEVITARRAEALFHSGATAEQVEQQISLLTQAMAESMIYASGAFPDLTEGELPKPPQQGAGYGYSAPVKPKRATAWSAARSLQLHDAARLSFATASLVGALTKLKSQSGQRFTTRQTWIPDSDEAKKPRKITTFTHTLVAPRDVAQFEPAKDAASANAARPETAQ